ncbi:MAG: hypothetical protein Q4D76_03630 [Oscillospiraceae bacterium]|nr:hypothetical protein [Oscillospiraceae bacterium]
MIATLLIIIGFISGIFGIWLVFRTLISPFKKEMKEMDGEQLVNESRTAEESLHKKRIKHVKIGTLFVLTGVITVLIGWYIGRAARGDDFWLHKLLFPNNNKPGISDKLDEEGNYIAKDGLSYSYYIIIKGTEYYFCGTKFDDIESLKEELENISSENTVIIIDSYAIESNVNQIVDLLETDMGLKYEIEQE